MPGRRSRRAGTRRRAACKARRRQAPQCAAGDSAALQHPSIALRTCLWAAQGAWLDRHGAGHVLANGRAPAGPVRASAFVECTACMRLHTQQPRLTPQAARLRPPQAGCLVRPPAPACGAAAARRRPLMPQQKRRRRRCAMWRGLCLPPPPAACHADRPSARCCSCPPLQAPPARKRRKIDPMTPPPPASEFPAYEPRPFFKFELLHQSSKSGARVGRIHTPHGTIDTPGFVAVGTNAALKAVDGPWADAEGQQLMFCVSGWGAAGACGVWCGAETGRHAPLLRRALLCPPVPMASPRPFSIPPPPPPRGAEHVSLAAAPGGRRRGGGGRPARVHEPAAAAHH